MEDTESCRVSSPDPFCISSYIQKVSGDLHYLLAKRLANTFWLSSLVNVNLISPEVFFFNLHLLKALKLYPYRTKVQWVITKMVLNSKIYVASCFFYIPTISTNKRYEDLAASIGSTMRHFISFILMILTPRKPLYSQDVSSFLCLSPSGGRKQSHVQL